jgi:Colicin V production protein
MTIWILALVLLASLAALGYRQGAIRVAFSFIGILFAFLLAAPLGKLFKPLLPHVGVHSLMMLWVIPPVIGFVLVMILFKVAAFFVHHKVEMFYKYKAGDLRLSLWIRLNRRLGACAGLLNGSAYFVLICFVIFNLSYWTVPITSSHDETRNDEPWSTKLVNRLGHDLHNTGMDKAAETVATLPENYYKMADLAGLICQNLYKENNSPNPEFVDRLANYPAFISLMERDDLQQLAQNADFTNAWTLHAPMGQILDEPSVKGIIQNSDLLNTVLEITQNNLDDLTNYLQTGKSAKYDSEKILGRWDFDVGVTIAMLRQTRPKITSPEMKSIRALWTQAYAQTVFIAGADNQAFLKNLPTFKPQTADQPPGTDNWKGQWSNDGANYSLTLAGASGNKSMSASTPDGLRLTLKDEKNTLIFDRAD